MEHREDARNVGGLFQVCSLLESLPHPCKEEHVIFILWISKWVSERLINWSVVTQLVSIQTQASGDAKPSWDMNQAVWCVILFFIFLVEENFAFIYLIYSILNILIFILYIWDIYYLISEIYIWYWILTLWQARVVPQSCQLYPVSPRCCCIIHSFHSRVIKCMPSGPRLPRFESWLIYLLSV